MKFKLFFLAIFVLIFSGNIFAQDHSKFAQEFNTWKTSVIEIDEEAQNKLFFMVKAIRNDSRSATAEIGLFGVLKNYEIIVTPLKYEKDESGKLVQTKTFDEVKLATKAPNNEEYKNAKLHTPIIKLLANSEANALSIELKSEDGNNPKITVRLKQDQATYGKLLLK